MGSSLALSCAGGSAAADPRIDYAGEMDVQFGAVESALVQLPPWLTSASPSSSAPGVVGRVYGRIDIAPTVSFAAANVGVRLGLYSNDGGGGVDGDGDTPIDQYDISLTRLKPRTALDFDHLALFYQGPAGEAELGWGVGVSERAAVTGPHDYGAGAFAGDYPYFLENPHPASLNTVSAYGSGDTSPRLLYFTPRLYGLRLGGSFQPDTRDEGFDFHHGASLGVLGLGPTPTGTFEGAAGGFTDVWEGGVDLDRTFGAVRVRASLGDIHGNAVASPTGAQFHDLDSLQAGLQVDYGGWSAGAGGVAVGSSGVTITPQTPKRLVAYTISGGVQYAVRGWTWGAGALYSTDPFDPTFRSDRQMHVYNVGVRKTLSDHFDLGVEIDQVQTEAAVYGDYANWLGLVQLRYRFGSRAGG